MTFVPHAVHDYGLRWLAVRNDSTEDAPPFAAMRITGVTTLEGQAVLTVDKPNADNATQIVFNGPFKIGKKIGSTYSYGSATKDLPLYAAYEVADAPVLADDLGTSDGEWVLRKGNTGFKAIGGTTSGRMQIDRAGSLDNLERVKLTSALQPGGYCKGKLAVWDGTALTTPGDELHFVDMLGTQAAGVGAIGYAQFFSDRSKYLATVSTGTGRWTLSLKPDWDSGDPVLVKLDASGVYPTSTPQIVKGTIYYVHKVTDTTWTLHVNSSDGTSGSSPISYSDTGTAKIFLVSISCPIELIDLPKKVLVKTTTAHAKGATHDCDIYTGSKGSEATTSVSISCYNRFADLASGKFAHAVWIDTGFELDAGECSA